MKIKPAKTSLFSGLDYLVIIGCLPLSIWIMSFVQGLDSWQKLGGAMVLMIIILGIEMLAHSLMNPEKKVMKERIFMEDIHIDWAKIMTPQFIVNFVLSFTTGGMLGYVYLEPHFLIFAAAGLSFFVMLVGIEIIFLDSFNMKDRYFFDEMVSSIMSFFSHLYLNPIYRTSILGFIMGWALSYFFYSVYLNDLIFSGIIFAVIGYGVTLLIQQSKTPTP